ncbi:hypothetical protein [Tenacibaculum maritimum]|uniref:hypothetical protein n=1 Tax=Tenacibaculum maritimum TaxID=107401 RepID=UPI003876ED6C
MELYNDVFYTYVNKLVSIMSNRVEKSDLIEFYTAKNLKKEVGINKLELKEKYGK